MKKEAFIVKTMSSLDGLQRAVPEKDVFRAVMNRLEAGAQIVSMVSYPKLAVAAAAFSGLLLLNIFLLRNNASVKSDDLQSLVQQYGLVNDDKIMLP